MILLYWGSIRRLRIVCVRVEREDGGDVCWAVSRGSDGIT